MNYHQKKHSWDGWNCINISDFLGHENFFHKLGFLFVLHKCKHYFFKKGSLLTLDDNGDLIGGIPESSVDPRALKSFKNNIKNRDLQND
jgi:hypothetical protein